MTTAYTSLLGLALPVTGELSGTWGDTVNNSITSLLDSAIAGTQTITADTTLTTTTGAANQSRQAILLCSPASANITITAPAQSKIYMVINTSAVYTVTVRGVGPTTGVTLGVSEKAVVAWNGSDFIKISNTTGDGTFANLTVTGNTTLGDADTDTITQTASYVTGTQLKSAKTATNTLSLAAYDTDGTAYTNLITLTASTTPTLALTSTGVGTINNMSIGATTASTGAFTTLGATGNVTLGDASADTVTVNGTTTFNASPIISVTDNTNAALRITQLGTGNALLVEDSTNPDSSPFVIDASGQVVQGYTVAINNWNGAPDSIAISSTASNARPSVGLINWSSNTGRSSSFNLYKSVSNTIGTQGIVGNLQQLGRITFSGDDGATFIRGVEIDAFVDGTPGLNDMPGGLRFSTTADGASTPTERMRIDSSGNVLVTNAAGLGYGTGAGGAVTQLTSRTTGVTLSKPTGAITMFSAAGSATAATFTVTNTLVAATDTIILNQKSGTNLYVLLVTAVAAGSFNVTFYTTGGTATDAPVINFSLIKGAVA